jgi:hypothetical protein
MRLEAFGTLLKIKIEIKSYKLKLIDVFIILKYELKRVKYHISVLYFKAHLQLAAESGITAKLVAPNSNLHQKLVANQNIIGFDT